MAMDIGSLLQKYYYVTSPVTIPLLQMPEHSGLDNPLSAP